MNVYNLSEMTEEAALEFLFKAEGRACTRLLQREDGTIVTKDCPAGLAAKAGRATRRAVGAVVLAVFLILGGWVIAVGAGDRSGFLDDMMVFLGLKASPPAMPKGMIGDTVMIPIAPVAPAPGTGPVPGRIKAGGTPFQATKP